MEQTEIINAAPRANKQERIQHRTIKTASKNSGTILIVEDESELAEVLEFNLRRQGFTVLVAKDGLEACRSIGRDQPELILLDLMLPLLDGWEICGMVRSHQDPIVAKTPIIMLSALGSADDRIKGYDLGADLYLPKPYVIKEVIVKSRQLIQQRREYLQQIKQLSSLQNWSELQDHWQQALFHEFRNQLTMISGMAEHLQHSTRELPHERSVQFAGQIANCSLYLGTIAENYLLVRQVEKNLEGLQTEEIRLQDLLMEIVQLSEPLAVKKACELDITCPANVTVKVHPIGLKIILSNLIDNALKYSPLDSHVTLSVTEKETLVLIKVQDDGPGIPAGERDKVFDRFYRGDAAQKNSPGSGLGLYMARILAQSIGGTLQFAEKQFPGCCLELRLFRTE